MAFRFYNGRIVTDEEFYELGTSSVKTVFIGLTYAFGVLAAWTIPAIGLTALGYFIALYIGALIGLVIGVIISYIFNKFLAKLFQILIGIIAIGIVVGLIIALIYVAINLS